MTDTRHIPADVARQVRQECYFGCVICGMPVFEYDHIEDFATVRTHEPANLALLCPNHHRDKTSGRLSREAVTAAREQPFNTGRRFSVSYGLQAARQLEMCIGTNCGTAPSDAEDYPVVWINGESLLTVHREGPAYTYSARVTDESGQLLLSIEREALAIATDVWDYQYEGRRLSVRRAAGDILFDATVEDGGMRVHRGAFIDQYEAGLVVKRDGTAAFTMSGLELDTVANGRFSGNRHCMIGIVRGACYSGEIPRGGGMLRQWLPEFENTAAELQRQMASGAPGRYPPGLESFRPFPR